jgi:hypothetical protein
VGEHHVEHDHVGPVASRDLEPRFAVRGLEDVVPRELEIEAAQQQDVGLVVDHQHAHVSWVSAAGVADAIARGDHL